MGGAHDVEFPPPAAAMCLLEHGAVSLFRLSLSLHNTHILTIVVPTIRHTQR